MTIQRTIQQKQGTVDATGKCVITFDPPPLGSVLTGAMTLVDPPSGTLWSVLSNGLPIDEIVGTSTVGNIQAFTNEIITIVGTNLPVGVTVHATWVAAQHIDDGTVPVVNPGQDSQQTLAGYARVLFNGLPTFTTVTVNLTPTDRSLFVFISGIVTINLISAIGNNTKVDWNTFAGTGSNNNPFGVGVTTALIPVVGALDTQVTLTISSNVGLNFVSVVAYPDQVLGGSIAAPSIVTPGGVGTVQPFTAVTVSTAASSTTNMLITPGVGTYYEIAYMHVFAATAAAGVQAAFIAGHTSGAILLLGYEAAAGVAVHSDSHFYLNEGLDIHNQATGVSATGVALYRIVPILGQQ